MSGARPIRVAVVGSGQLARVQPGPVRAAYPDVELGAIPTPNPRDMPAGIPSFTDTREMLDAVDIDAVALCTPPQVRGDLARLAMARGKHVMLEKPPAGTVAEAGTLEGKARRHGVTIFATWHSMFSAAVVPLRDVLARRGLRAMHVAWKEDVDKWHPGATWFWRAGGLGVFDPAINAFSIVVATSPEPVFVTAAEFGVAAGAQTPERATLTLATPTRRDAIAVELDWRHRDAEEWTIRCTLADGGEAVLRRGGAFLAVDGEMVVDGHDEEYAGLYRRFSALIRTKQSDLELRPMQLAADAFMIAERNRV